MLFAILALSFIVGYCLIYGAYYVLAADRLKLEARLMQIRGNKKVVTTEGEDDLERSFMDRIIRPLLNWLVALTKGFTPAKKKDQLEKRLALAGSPWGLSANEFQALHYTLAIVLGLVGFSLGTLAGVDAVLRILLATWFFCFGFIFLQLLLRTKTKSRQEAISKDLPDVLDLLTVSVEAGLGFDAALQKVVQKVKGPIAFEFAKTLQEIKMGKHRREALKDLTVRTGVEDLNTFISAIIQADQLGISIGNVLRVQSEQMRLIRRQRVEEKAMKAPIKMLLPMVLFIFPTIFIVLLGPALIQIMNNLL